MARMHRLYKLVLFVAGALLLAGCETNPSKEAVGTGFGALLGGLIGTQIGSGSGRTGATIAGAILGGAVGNSIGRRMDEDDRRRVSQALESSPTGQETRWRNETTGNSFAVTPTRNFEQDGRQCRAFEQQAIIDGETRTISATACKRPDGMTWEET